MAHAPQTRIQGRTQTGGRVAAEKLRVFTSSAASDSVSRVGALTQDVIGRLGSVANGVVQQRTAQKYDDDLAKGQQARTQESLSGTEAQSDEQLITQTDAYRRGYRITEAANRMNEAQIELTRKVASLEPDQDPSAVIDETLSGVLADKHFQDPQVMRRLQPIIQATRDQAMVQYEKVERAELLERQVENLTTMARSAVQTGQLNNHEQIGKFLNSLDTEDYGFIDHDMGMDIVADAIRDRLETGSVDPDTVTQFLQSKIPGTESSMWDRKDANGNAWADQFENAAKHGRTVIAEGVTERRQLAMAGDEVDFQRKAERGQMTPAVIYKAMEKYALPPKEQQQFIRYWYNQNEAGIKAMEARAKEAAKEGQTSFALMTGNVLAYTTEQLTTQLSKEFRKATLAGDKVTQNALLGRAAAVGLVVPQVRDIMARTTKDNLGQNYEVYRTLVAKDPVLAERYIPDSLAVNFDLYHRAITEQGYSPQEALRTIPTGTNKATREEAADRVRRGSAEFFKDTKNLKLADGAPLTPQMQREAVRIANELAVSSPEASMETIMPLAVRRMQASRVNINGTWVPSGQMRNDEAAVLTGLAQRAGKELAAAGQVPEEMAERMTFAPLPNDPSVVALYRPDMLLQTNPKTGKPITFNVREVTDAKVAHEEALGLFKAQTNANSQWGAKPKQAASQGPGLLANPSAAPVTSAVPQRWSDLSPTLRSLAPLEETTSTTSSQKAPPPEDFVDFLSTYKPKGK